MSRRPTATAAAAALFAGARTRHHTPASPVTLCTDGLEGNNYWTGSGTGADWLCEISAAQAHAGAKSLHAKTRTTGAAPNDLLIAYRNWTWQETHHLIESVWLFLPDPTKHQVLWWWAQACDGLHTYHPHIAWWMPTMEASYWDAAGTPIACPALDHIWLANTWTHLTLEIDLQGKKYIAAAAGADAADLSGIPFQQAGASSLFLFQAELGQQALGAAPAEAYLDDLTITYTVP